MAKERTEVPAEEKWNVEALYLSLDDWKKDFTKWQGEAAFPRWPVLASYRGRLGQSPQVLLEMCNYYLSLDRSLSKLYTYAHLRHDEDVANDLHKQAYQKIVSLLHAFRQEASWIEPEILQLPEELVNDPILAPYRVTLDKIIRLKPHTLSAREEEMLAMAGQALEASSRAFSAFNNADLKFPKIKDGKGEEHELTHGKLSTYLRSQDRTLRQNAFQTMHGSFLSYENTLSELINGEAQQHLFAAKARKFSSCLQAALFPHNIDVSVYHNLIATVRKNLHVLHNYMNLRKKILGYETLHMWDLHVPLVPAADLSMSYEEAEKLVIESVEPLGKEYQTLLGKGLTIDRWVDRYENARKRSGAYSSGCYDSLPYILMNYHGNFHDVMTLAHEAGHSMHSLLSWKNQTYQNASYPIFVAEVASTFNEELVMRHLLARTSEKDKRAYLINQKIEDIRNTFFRQTMLAEFELKVHRFVEEGTPLTPALLKSEYRQLNLDYFGSAVEVDADIDIEWARIPHFYYNFYVYQYATGISAALSLVDIVAKEGPANYLKFLSSGGSKYPLDLLKIAGVDMQKPEGVAATIRRFEELTLSLADCLPRTAEAGSRALLAGNT